MPQTVLAMRFRYEQTNRRPMDPLHSFWLRDYLASGQRWRGSYLVTLEPLLRYFLQPLTSCGKLKVSGQNRSLLFGMRYVRPLRHSEPQNQHRANVDCMGRSCHRGLGPSTSGQAKQRWSLSINLVSIEVLAGRRQSSMKRPDDFQTSLGSSGHDAGLLQHIVLSRR